MSGRNKQFTGMVYGVHVFSVFKGLSSFYFICQMFTNQVESQVNTVNKESLLDDVAYILYKNILI